MRMLRYVVIAVVGIVLLAPLVFSVMNRGVVRELREQPDGERAKEVMLLTLPSKKSIPVNYLREDEIVWAAADFPWWRELRGDGEPVTVWIRGESLRGLGRAVEDDPALRRSVFERLRPTAPLWAGTLLEIRLAEVPE